MPCRTAWRPRPRQAAVAHQGLAAEPARVVGAEEPDDAGHVLGGGHPLARGGGHQPGRHLVPAVPRVKAGGVGLHRPGTDGVHVDAQGGQFHRQVADQRFHGRLGRPQDAVAGDEPDAVVSRHGDDLPLPPLHEGDRRLDHLDEGLDGDGNGPLDVVRPHGQEGLEGRGGGIGHQDVQDPGLLPDAVHHGRHCLGVFQVRPDRDAAPPVPGDGFGNPTGVLLPLLEVDEDRGSLAAQGAGHRLADAAGGAGHQGHLAGKAHAHPPLVALPVYG